MNHCQINPVVKGPAPEVCAALTAVANAAEENARAIAKIAEALKGGDAIGVIMK